MNNRQNNLRSLAELSLFAALIFMSIQFFRIQLGPQFIHFGNALVVLACLLFGWRKGFIASAVGLGIFDIYNGYIAELWIIILEALAVAILVHLIYQRFLKADDRVRNIILVALAAALTKILLNLIRYTLTTYVLGQVSLDAAFLASLLKILGTFGSALATIIATPLLYPSFKKILNIRKKEAQKSSSLGNQS